MKYKILGLVAVAAGAYWFWCISSSNEQDAISRQKQAPAESARPEAAEAVSVYTHVERPHLPWPARQSGPAVERVDFDRRPWDPTKELKETYEVRAETFEAFDRFREETGMSDERAQALLMLMYDFQETVKILNEELHGRFPYRDEWEFEYLLRKKSADWRTVMFDTRQQLDAMLSPEELKVWWDSVEQTSIWLKLSAHLQLGSLLVPVDASQSPGRKTG
jgi:hypothetical protein